MSLSDKSDADPNAGRKLEADWAVLTSRTLQKSPTLQATPASLREALRAGIIHSIVPPVEGPACQDRVWDCMFFKACNIRIVSDLFAKNERIL